METTPSPALYKSHRFPPEIISHCVWLYYRFSLSYRDIEEIMCAGYIAYPFLKMRGEQRFSIVLVYNFLKVFASIFDFL